MKIGHQATIRMYNDPEQDLILTVSLFARVTKFFQIYCGKWSDLWHWLHAYRNRFQQWKITFLLSDIHYIFFLLTNFNNSRRFRGPFKSISSSVEICETYLFGDFRCLDILSNGRRNCSHLSNLSLCTWVARNNGSGWISKQCPFLLK